MPKRAPQPRPPRSACAFSVGVGGGHLAAVLTLDTLRNIAYALRAWPTPMGLGISSHEPITSKVEAKLFEIVRQVMSRGPGAQ